MRVQACIKNVITLWCKKLSLSVCRLSKAADLDHHWVAKAWLSDVGLPQYSQAFHTHLVDGRLLNSLTRRDLERYLNITKKSHQVSLLLGIELLQFLHFDKEVSKNTSQKWVQLNVLKKKSCQLSEHVLYIISGIAGSQDAMWAPEYGSFGMDIPPGREMDQRCWPQGGTERQYTLNTDIINKQTNKTTRLNYHTVSNTINNWDHLLTRAELN